MKIISIKNECKLFESKSPEEIFNWINQVLLATADFSFLGELNEMQGHAGVELFSKEKKTRFDSKYEIPVYFVNLIIKDYGLKVIE